MSSISLAYYYVGLVVLYVAAATEKPSPDQGFRNFLIQSLSNYQSWAVSKNLEPLRISSIINLTSTTSTTSFSGEARNHTIHGLSDLDTNYTSVYSSLLGGDITIHADVKQGLYLEGEYNLNGSIFSTVPVKGSGHFNSTRGSYATIEIGFANFEVINDHIQLRDNEKIHSYPPNFRHLEIEFDGLEAGDYITEFWIRLENNYGVQMQDILKQVMYDNFKAFFQEIFDKTPLSEIIKTEDKEGGRMNAFRPYK